MMRKEEINAIIFVSDDCVYRKYKETYRKNIQINKWTW